MKNANRPLTGYQNLYLSKLPKVALTITRNLTDEYFASLQYYSEIEEVGLELIKAHGHEGLSQQKRIFSLFQSFVRQGKTFFEAAEKLDYRASPLLYYYSFLNLTKAYLCLKNPDEVDKKIKHGLIHNHTLTEFQDQSVLVLEGVFPIFYRTLMDASIESPLSLNISSLFGYIPDINYEYQMVKYGQTKFITGLSRVFTNNHTKKAWPFLAVSKQLEEAKKYDSFFKAFFEYFEEVDLHQDILKEIFNIDAEEKQFLIFLQSKKEYDFIPENFIPRQQIHDDCLSFMKNYCKPVSTQSKMEFLLFLPLEKELQIPFNDILATYVIMFYLGSLIRYYPSYLENLLNSKHAWLIEGFTKQVGGVFLRNITNLIIQKNFVYSTI